MKNLLSAVILGIVLAGAAIAQTAPGIKAGGRQAGKGAEIKAAVVEFTTGPKASGMTPEAKRQFQTSLAATLARSDKFDIADIRWTRNESEENLAAINEGSSTSAAVKLGKRLGVSYVLTGIVLEYAPKGADNFGRVVFKTRLIDVGTGKVVHASETTQRSTSAMHGDGAVEMQGKTIKPAVEKLKAELMELRF